MVVGVGYHHFRTPPVYSLVFKIPAAVWFGLGLGLVFEFQLPPTNVRCPRKPIGIYCIFTQHLRIRFTPLKNLKTNMSPKNQLLENVFPTKIVPFLGTC